MGNTAALNTLMDDDVTVIHPTNRIVKEKKELMEMITLLIGVPIDNQMKLWTASASPAD